MGKNRKKILFVIPDFWLAGTNKSLENLLSILDEDKFDINVFSLSNDGNDYVKQQFKPYLVKPSICYYVCSQNYYTRKVFNLLTLRKDRIKFVLQKKQLYHLCKVNNYDCIIAYSEGAVTKLVAELNVSSKKIAWIHWFYGSGVINDCDKKKDAFTYSNFDNIVCVSKKAAEAFMNYFPKLSNIVQSIYNVLDTKRIIEQGNVAANDLNINNKTFIIVSVGRMAWGKQLHLIPIILSQALEKTKNKDIIWYIIGEQVNSQNEFEKNLREHKMEGNVIHLGVRDNPYPYIKQADLLVCPSIAESFSYVINEAKVLHTPVMANDFPVAYEMLNDMTGIVCPVSNMGRKLAELIDNENGEYSKVKDGVQSFVYDNHAIIKQIDDLMSK